MTSEAYEALARTLAAMPVTANRLLVEHQPDRKTGLCRGCRRPGSGYLYLPYPCSLARLAMRALAIRKDAQ